VIARAVMIGTKTSRFLTLVRPHRPQQRLRPGFARIERRFDLRQGRGLACHAWAGIEDDRAV